MVWVGRFAISDYCQHNAKHQILTLPGSLILYLLGSLENLSFPSKSGRDIGYWFDIKPAEHMYVGVRYPEHLSCRLSYAGTRLPVSMCLHCKRQQGHVPCPLMSDKRQDTILYSDIKLSYDHILWVRVISITYSNIPIFYTFQWLSCSSVPE